MISHLSKDAQNLLKAMLRVREAKRLTVLDILHSPMVKAEVLKLLFSSRVNKQFDALMGKKLNYAGKSKLKIHSQLRQKASPSNADLLSHLKYNYFKCVSGCDRLDYAITAMKNAGRFFPEEVI